MVCALHGCVTPPPAPPAAHAVYTPAAWRDLPGFERDRVAEIDFTNLTGEPSKPMSAVAMSTGTVAPLGAASTVAPPAAPATAAPAPSSASTS